ncbi:serine hydrolase domain-containing protein [Cellulomonas triticagri]|uniref:Class A beta-lactamase-related serine hydrolase n=1 Tax=Cellulomonas triticagri TaxID=2483352 RepID=A0A3M2JGR8_9CELL|nr:serine hydrolase domain-containing protein [Cellulomonas triticagri]RMI09468.1 class A beta-lactamase-related serine hydrolase [Cellulomonas triticagri]
MTADDAARTATSLHERALASGFSGVIRVDHAGAAVHEQGYGLADRAHAVPCTPGHRFGLASIAKGFTALTVGTLVDEGVLGFATPVREVLGADLPLVDDAVTVDHLLSHTSGIGDYIDESAGGEITDYVLRRPVHELDDVEAFLPELDGRPQVQAPGTGFAYNNSGYALLAVVAQRVAGVPFADLVTERVLTPAGMSRSGFLRSDALPGDVARGYLDADGLRTNVLHLPVVATGDGGAHATAADLAAFWRALLAGDLVSAGTLAALTDPRSVVEDEGMRYGAGFWRGLDSEALVLEGYDAGVSGRTWYDPATDVTATVLANWSDGAWPVLSTD